MIDDLTPGRRGTQSPWTSGQWQPWSRRCQCPKRHWPVWSIGALRIQIRGREWDYSIGAGHIADRIVGVFVLDGGNFAGKSVRNRCSQCHKADCRHRIFEANPASLKESTSSVKSMLHSQQKCTYKLGGQVADDGREDANLGWLNKEKWAEID